MSEDLLKRAARRRMELEMQEQKLVALQEYVEYEDKVDPVEATPEHRLRRTPAKLTTQSVHCIGGNVMVPGRVWADGEGNLVGVCNVCDELVACYEDLRMAKCCEHITKPQGHRCSECGGPVWEPDNYMCIACLDACNEMGG